MNDTGMATLVRDAVRDTHMTVPESDITRRARRLRTRRRVTAGGAAVASIAAGLAVATLAAPASSPATGQAQNTAQLTAWTVTKHPGGVIDVTIRELKDPAGLQARLRADGVPINVSFSGPNPACDPYYPDYRYIAPGPIRWVGEPGKYPWIHSYDNGSVTMSVTSPTDLTLALRPARMPRGTAFQIVALRGHVTGWGLVKTSPACTGLRPSRSLGSRNIGGVVSAVRCRRGRWLEEHNAEQEGSGGSRSQRQGQARPDLVPAGRSRRSARGMDYVCAAGPAPDDCGPSYGRLLPA